MATGMYPSMYRPNISNLHEAAYIKKRVSIPVCIVGGIRNADDAEKIIAEGKVDLVAMGRQLNKADPNFANKVTAGQADEIDSCLRWRHLAWAAAYHPPQAGPGGIGAEGAAAHGPAAG